VPPGGPAYRFDDLVLHLAEVGRHGFGDDRLARVLAVPVAYVRTVREVAGLVAAEGSKGATP
jgi:hypothetical protein